MRYIASWTGSGFYCSSTLKYVAWNNTSWNTNTWPGGSKIFDTCCVAWLAPIHCVSDISSPKALSMWQPQKSTIILQQVWRHLQNKHPHYTSNRFDWVELLKQTEVIYSKPKIHVDDSWLRRPLWILPLSPLGSQLSADVKLIPGNGSSRYINVLRLSVLRLIIKSCST